MSRFLSTLSLRRATHSGHSEPGGNLDFYPRSPCGERLHNAGPLPTVCRDFYPRSPCGERPKELTLAAKNAVFLSTLSLRRATHPDHGNPRRLVISIHALLAESDDKPAQPSPAAVQFLSTLSLRRATRQNIRGPQACAHFYPRSPCGERQGIHTIWACTNNISIHALLAESDGNYLLSSKG